LGVSKVGPDGALAAGHEVLTSRRGRRFHQAKSSKRENANRKFLAWMNEGHRCDAYRSSAFDLPGGPFS